MSYFGSIRAADSPSIDAFGRWRTSEPLTVFDSKLILDNQPLLGMTPRLAVRARQARMLVMSRQLIWLLPQPLPVSAYAKPLCVLIISPAKAK